MKTLTMSLLAIAGCSWTSFDDLEKDTWVHSTTKPDGNSNDYGVAIQRGVRAGDGGDLIAIGAGQALYSELKYTAAGAADLDGATEQKLNTQFGIGNLDLQPILLADPDTDDISLIVNSGGSSIAVLTGTHELVVRQIFGPSNPDTAIYMNAPGQTTAQPIVAALDSVFGVLAAEPSPSPVCALVDGAALALQIKAIGAARITQTATDDVVIWNSDGSLLLYDGTVFAGCTGTHAPLATSESVATGFMPGKGSTIETFGGHFVLLSGHHDADTASEMLVYDVSAKDPADSTKLKPLAIGSPISKAGQRSAVVLELGAAPSIQRFAVAGYPNEVIDGTTSGQVLVYPLDTATGINAQPKITLNDAQPDSNEQFGRALAVMPFNNSPILVVAADNEIFAYYRTDPLYPETRNPNPNP